MGLNSMAVPGIHHMAISQNAIAITSANGLAIDYNPGPPVVIRNPEFDGDGVGDGEVLGVMVLGRYGVGRSFGVGEFWSWGVLRVMELGNYGVGRSRRLG